MNHRRCLTVFLASSQCWTTYFALSLLLNLRLYKAYFGYRMLRVKPSTVSLVCRMQTAAEKIMKKHFCPDRLQQSQPSGWAQGSQLWPAARYWCSPAPPGKEPWTLRQLFLSIITVLSILYSDSQFTQLGTNWCYRAWSPKSIQVLVHARDSDGEPAGKVILGSFLAVKISKCHGPSLQADGYTRMRKTHMLITNRWEY